jgi:oligopeptide transport system ATP-binding protein
VPEKPVPGKAPGRPPPGGRDDPAGAVGASAGTTNPFGISLEAPVTEPLLQARDLVQEFTVRGQGGVRGGVVQAVSSVSLDIFPGETLSVVGETGSGKSTLARSIMHAPPPKSGDVVFQGTSLTRLRGAALRDARRSMQMIFQDPYTSLDPLWSVSRIVAEPLIASGLHDRAKRRQRVAELLDQVGLDASVHGPRRARELSGGQCQRVAIARALAASPALIIADEAVSSLDVLVQAQVLNLLEGLRTSLDLSYLFIAHDLALVKQVSDRVAVMYLGRLCETGPADEVYAHPLHPYTVELLDAVPRVEQAELGKRPAGDLPTAGDPASPVNPPSGCRFRTRCPRARSRCAQETPALAAAPGAGGGHLVACHFPVTAGDQAAAGGSDGASATGGAGATRAAARAAGAAGPATNPK